MDSVRAILHAVQNGNYELAYRTARREATADPASDVYLALTVYTAGLLNDGPTVRAVARDACAHASAKTVKMFLAPTLVRFFEADTLMQAFVRANRLAPLDAELAQGWLEAALQLGDLPAAQKALMALLRNAKEPRAACFQACLVMALAPENKVFPLLANRMLEKHLPVTSSEECYVVALARRMLQTQQMVDYLLRDGRQWLAGTLELQLLLLSGLLATENYAEVFRYAEERLSVINSYNYFEALNTAAVRLQKVDDARSVIARFSGFNARLAEVDLAQKAGLDVDAQVAAYWTQFSTKASTFKFLRPFVSESNIAIFDAATSLPALVNANKLRHFVGQQLQVSDLLKIYEEHASEKPAEKTDYFIGTDLLLLASRLILEENAAYARERAAAMLEKALKLDPLNFEVKTQLVCLYRSLNCFSLALKLYTQLSIQHIQQDTLGHLLYTRVSTTAPQQLKNIENKLESNRRNAEKFGLYSQTALSTAAYTKFEGIFQLGVKLTRNVGAPLLDLEKIRAARLLRGTPQVTQLRMLPDDLSILEDVRDFSAVQNLCPVGPVPARDYVTIQRAKELGVLEKRALGLDDAVAACTELTDIEKWSVQALDALSSDPALPADSVTPPLATKPLALDWYLYHWCYTVLDTIKLARTLGADWSSLREAVTSTTAVALQGLKEYETALHNAIEYGDKKAFAKQVVQEHRRSLALIKDIK